MNDLSGQQLIAGFKERWNQLYAQNSPPSVHFDTGSAEVDNDGVAEESDDEGQDDGVDEDSNDEGHDDGVAEESDDEGQDDGAYRSQSGFVTFSDGIARAPLRVEYGSTFLKFGVELYQYRESDWHCDVSYNGEVESSNQGTPRDLGEWAAAFVYTWSIRRRRFPHAPATGHDRLGGRQ